MVNVNGQGIYNLLFNRIEPFVLDLMLICCTVFAAILITKWGGRWDLNPRPPGPQPGALTN